MENEPKTTEAYRLVRCDITKGTKNALVTQALVQCGLCGTTLSATGGPRSGSICKPCGELVMSGQARGAVSWCDHSQYSFEEHGRHCPCGELMG